MDLAESGAGESVAPPAAVQSRQWILVYRVERSIYAAVDAVDGAAIAGCKCDSRDNYGAVEFCVGGIVGVCEERHRLPYGRGSVTRCVRAHELVEGRVVVATEPLP